MDGDRLDNERIAKLSNINDQLSPQQKRELVYVVELLVPDYTEGKPLIWLFNRLNINVCNGNVNDTVYLISLLLRKIEVDIHANSLLVGVHYTEQGLSLKMSDFRYVSPSNCRRVKLRGFLVRLSNELRQLKLCDEFMELLCGKIAVNSENYTINGTKCIYGVFREMERRGVIHSTSSCGLQMILDIVQSGSKFNTVIQTCKTFICQEWGDEWPPNLTKNRPVGDYQYHPPSMPPAGQQPIRPISGPPVQRAYSSPSHQHHDPFAHHQPSQASPPEDMARFQSLPATIQSTPIHLKRQSSEPHNDSAQHQPFPQPKPAHVAAYGTPPYQSAPSSGYRASPPHPSASNPPLPVHPITNASNIPQYHATAAVHSQSAQYQSYHSQQQLPQNNQWLHQSAPAHHGPVHHGSPLPHQSRPPDHPSAHQGSFLLHQGPPHSPPSDHHGLPSASQGHPSQGHFSSKWEPDNSHNYYQNYPGNPQGHHQQQQRYYQEHTRMPHSSQNYPADQGEYLHYPQSPSYYKPTANKTPQNLQYNKSDWPSAPEANVKPTQYSNVHFFNDSENNSSPPKPSVRRRINTLPDRTIVRPFLNPQNSFPPFRPTSQQPNPACISSEVIPNALSQATPPSYNATPTLPAPVPQLLHPISPDRSISPDRASETSIVTVSYQTDGTQATGSINLHLAGFEQPSGGNMDTAVDHSVHPPVTVADQGSISEQMVCTNSARKYPRGDIPNDRWPSNSTHNYASKWNDC